MIKHYTFDYDDFKAQVSFKVNTDKFSEDYANHTLGFFLWDYDKEKDPIDEVLKKYAIMAIEIGASEHYNVIGVKEVFENKEGFLPLDGVHGIELMTLNNYEFDEDSLTCTIVNEG